MSRSAMARSPKRKGMSVTTILSIVIVLLLSLGLGLWLLKENAPAPTIAEPNQVSVKPATQSTSLPSRPEEVYSYIRDLETREVVSNVNKPQVKSEQLSKEQLKQLEEKRKQEEVARLAVEQPVAEVVAEPEITQQVKAPEVKQQAISQNNTANNLAQKEREQKATEEKRKQAEKQAELKKQQELAKKSEIEKAKNVPTKPEEKNTVLQPKAGSFGLQCGAYKNKAQAENMQARLAMAGFNARIVSSADWNRIYVGPIGNRAAAATAQSNARSVAECVIIAM